MAEYLLPKGYLSWSQMQVWETNKGRYRREYFETGKKLDTKYLRFGKSVAEKIEDGSYKDILPDLEVYQIPEYKILVTLDGVELLSYVDSYYKPGEPDPNVFKEVKTGKHPWTQLKVQNHGQLLFYAVGLRIAHGSMPPFCELDWLETKDTERKEKSGFYTEDDKIVLTGKMKTFRRYFDERELDAMEARILKNAKEIDEAYRLFINEI